MLIYLAQSLVHNYVANLLSFVNQTIKGILVSDARTTLAAEWLL